MISVHMCACAHELAPLFGTCHALTSNKGRSEPVKTSDRIDREREREVHDVDMKWT